MFGNLNKRKQYILSYHITQNNNVFKPSLRFCYDDDTFSTARNDGNTDIDITTTSDKNKRIKSIGFVWSTQNGGGIVKFSNIMLREVDTDDSFIEHEEQTITFPLIEGQVLHKNDYLADDGIHHERKTVAFNGTENWFPSTKNTHQWFGLNLSGVKRGTSFICNILKDKTRIGNYAGIANANAINRVYLSISENINTVDELKAYLAEQYANGTPVVIEYELQDEEIEAYTEEQQEAYEKIKELHSYQEVTHITCEDEIKTTQEVTYRKDFTLVQNNLQSQIDEIKASLASEVSE